MKNLFSIGELSKQQNISRQTLIFYDKIGLFPPAYVDPENGYRYYSSSQLDYLDTICIMKKIGFSLNEIKTYMENYTIDHSIVTLRKQLTIIEQQIQELQMIRNRVEHRCRQLEHAVAIRNSSDIVALENVKNQYILIQEVPSPAHPGERQLSLQKSVLSAPSGNSFPSSSKAGQSFPMSIF